MHPGTPASSGLPELTPQELCAFVSGVAARILRTLEQPQKARPPRRKPNHRRFLYNQLCRSLGDNGETARPSALNALSQESPRPQPAPRLPRSPSPFLGVAQVLAAPESPGPGLALSPRALRSPMHELLDIIPSGPGLAPVTADPSAPAQAPLLPSGTSDPRELSSTTRGPGPCLPSGPRPRPHLGASGGPWPAEDPAFQDVPGC